MANGFVETLRQFGTFAALIIFGIVLLAVLGSGTSIGRAMLPQPVTDAVAKLLPWSRITDASATATGEYQLQVSGNAQLRTVHVRRVHDMTTAWTFDPEAEFPQAGIFALTRFRHNLKPGSSNQSESFEARVRQALIETLAPKHFEPAESTPADICINVFGAIENEIAINELGNVFDRPDSREWPLAVKTALTHDSGEKVTTIARGSLVLEVIEPRSGHVLWHAAAIADIVVEVRDAEKYRRVHSAITEMLRKFPPGNVNQ